MGLFNPINVLLLPALVFIIIPLALFASVTTMLAFSVLFLRVMLVYLDVALSFLPQSLSIHRAHTHRLMPSDSPITNSTSRSPSPTLHRRRRRPSSSHSAISDGSMTSLTGLGLMPNVGPERDFEGIGGWRVGKPADDDAWMTVSPRAELHHGTRSHHHFRSQSGGAITPGEGGLMMKGRTRSPDTLKLSVSNSSKARTPPALRVVGDSYFPHHASSPKSVRG